MKPTAFERIVSLLEKAETNEYFSPTVLYKEGWMLKIILQILKDDLEYPPLNFQPEARWFSELKLQSPFHRREGEYARDKKEKRTKIAEGDSNLDGVIGHFDIREDTKVGFEFRDGATQFVVIEAKLFSELSEKKFEIKNKEGNIFTKFTYDQAARNVACMVWAIDQSGKSVEDFDSLGYYVIALEEQLDRKVTKNTFTKYVNKPSIERTVGTRVNGYKGRELYEILRTWYDVTFVPALDHIEVGSISWESLLDVIGDDSLHEFYELCKDFNRKKKLKK